LIETASQGPALGDDLTSREREVLALIVEGLLGYAFTNTYRSANPTYATEAINLVAQSWGRTHLGEGDEVLITWLEHHANIVP